MKKTNEHELIITILTKGFSNYIIEATRKEGATGATIFNGIGTSPSEIDSFMGIVIHPEKEVILCVVKSENRTKIMQAICEELRKYTESRGICFSVPIKDAVGLRG